MWMAPYSTKRGQVVSYSPLFETFFKQKSTPFQQSIKKECLIIIFRSKNDNVFQFRANSNVLSRSGHSIQGPR